MSPNKATPPKLPQMASPAGDGVFPEPKGDILLQTNSLDHRVSYGTGKTTQWLIKCAYFSSRGSKFGS